MLVLAYSRIGREGFTHVPSETWRSCHRDEVGPDEHDKEEVVDDEVHDWVLDWFQSVRTGPCSCPGKGEQRTSLGSAAQAVVLHADHGNAEPDDVDIVAVPENSYDDADDELRCYTPGQLRGRDQAEREGGDGAHFSDEPVVGFVFLLLPDALHFEVLTDPHQLDALALGFRAGRPRCRCWLCDVCVMASLVELAVEHALGDCRRDS